ncbi:MAG TPA: molybdenum cofactor guanylyltransferase [Erythrobacter sp.]|nr:molybdenum cofactor guanylyltransferase [Erythrobacter sp.]
MKSNRHTPSWRAMPHPPDIAVCILAGGSSRRFGSHKAFAELGGKPMLAHVIDCIRPQTSGPVLINANDTAAFSDFGLPIVPDGEWAGAGPLSGIHAALQWAIDAGREHIATLAVDQPFLPRNYLAMLLQAGAPAIARCGDRLHPINAVWSASQLPGLGDYLKTDRRDVHGWAEVCRANVAEFPGEPSAIDPFLNVNTMADLDIAAQLLAKR